MSRSEQGQSRFFHIDSAIQPQGRKHATGRSMSIALSQKANTPFCNISCTAVSTMGLFSQVGGMGGWGVGGGVGGWGGGGGVRQVGVS